MTILIIDDSENIRKVLKKSFSLIPNVTEILESDDITNGVEQIKKFQPSILILDLMLKTGTGFDVLKQIKEIKNKPYIILYSNFLEEEYKKRAKKFGVDDYFDKSDDILKLIKKIEDRINND